MENVLKKSLRTLASESDANRAVNLFLEYTGSWYQADRVVIFEPDPDGVSISNSYEWCAPGIESRMAIFQKMPASLVTGGVDFSEGAAHWSPAAADGEMSDMLRSRGVDNVLVIPMRRDGVLFGMLSVDNAKIHQEDDTLLRLAADLIAVEFQKRQLVQNMSELEYTDPLTGLPNRRRYLNVLEQYQLQPPRSLAAAFVDLNGTKEINEEEGQSSGDRFIQSCAEILRGLGLNAFRVDGDEFIILQPYISEEEARGFESRLRAALEQLRPRTAAVGVAYAVGGADVHELIAEADIRMYADKQVYYRSATAAGGTVRTGAAADVLDDIRKGSFLVHYQPQIDLESGDIYGAEALVRKRDEDGNFIPPGAFIPHYETDGVISHLDFHVLELVCADLRRWQDELGKRPKISVNFSRITLLEPNVVPHICEICDSFGIPHTQLHIEVTESAGKFSQEQLYSLIEALQEAEFPVCLDDFGSKYSNLSLLTNVDFQLIKLDKTLIDPICLEKKSANIVKNLIELCQDTLLTATLAEGVEDAAQAGLLRDFGCGYIQGYFFSRPVPSESFTDMLREDKRWPVEELPQAEHEALFSQAQMLANMTKDNAGNAYGYLVRDRSAILPPRMKEDYGMPTVLKDFANHQVRVGVIAQESVDEWMKVFESIDHGIPGGEADIRMKNFVGGQSWYRLRFTSMPDEHGRPHSAIITYTDVTEELEQSRRREQDISALLQATRSTFPEILTLNLTRDSYRMIQYDDTTTVGTPREGTIEEMVRMRISGVAGEDRQRFTDSFSLESLEKAFIEEGRTSVQLVYRRPGNDGQVYWFETTAIRQENTLNDDVLLVAMSRSVEPQ